MFCRNITVFTTYKAYYIVWLQASRVFSASPASKIFQYHQHWCYQRKDCWAEGVFLSIVLHILQKHYCIEKQYVVESWHTNSLEMYVVCDTKQPTDYTYCIFKAQTLFNANIGRKKEWILLKMCPSAAVPRNSLLLIMKTIYKGVFFAFPAKFCMT